MFINSCIALFIDGVYFAFINTPNIEHVISHKMCLSVGLKLGCTQQVYSIAIIADTNRRNNDNTDRVAGKWPMETSENRVSVILLFVSKNPHVIVMNGKRFLQMEKDFPADDGSLELKQREPNTNGDMPTLTAR